MRESGEERREIAFRMGLLFGLLIGAVFIAGDVIESYSGGSAAGMESLLALLRILAVLALPLVASLRAARASGSVGNGVYAGSLTGGSGAVLWALQLIVLPGFVPLLSMQVVNLGDFQTAAFCSIPLFAGVGGVVGLLGGLRGAAQFRRARAEEKMRKQQLRQG